MIPALPSSTRAVHNTMSPRPQNALRHTHMLGPKRVRSLLSLAPSLHISLHLSLHLSLALQLHWYTQFLMPDNR